MKVGKWNPPKTDEEIFMMIFEGTLKDIECPECKKSDTCCPNTETVECSECGEIYYSPIYDPELDI